MEELLFRYGSSLELGMTTDAALRRSAE